MNQSLPNPDSPGREPGCVIGIDLGGTKIAAGLVAFPKGRPLTHRVQPTLAARGGRAVLDDVLSLARELAQAGMGMGHAPMAIGLGICELVDLAGEVASANCIQWLGLPVRRELSAVAPAMIEADVRAAALAEALYGAGRPFRSFLYVTIGTGISSCLMLDGRPYLGARGLTGTLGSSALRLGCEHCGRVHERTLEEIASGPALVARYNALSHSATSGQEVFAALAAGDADALRVVQTAAETLGGQVGLAVNILDPEAVILGGGLGVSEGWFWDRMTEAIRQHIYSPLNRHLPILRAASGNQAGWIGAAASAWRSLKVGAQPVQSPPT